MALISSPLPPKYSSSEPADKRPLKRAKQTSPCCSSSRNIFGLSYYSLGEVQDLCQYVLVLVDLLLQQGDGIDQLLRPGRAPWHVNVYRNHLVHRHQSVV